MEGAEGDFGSEGSGGFGESLRYNANIRRREGERGESYCVGLGGTIGGGGDGRRRR